VPLYDQFMYTSGHHKILYETYIYIYIYIDTKEKYRHTLSDYVHLHRSHTIRQFTAIYNLHICQNDTIIYSNFVECMKYNYTGSNNGTVGTKLLVCFCVKRKKTRIGHVSYNFITYFIMRIPSSTPKYNNHTYIDIKWKCTSDRSLRSTHCYRKISVTG